ncbi:MAG: MBL fold metallo-hydrolase [Candidatus Harrisonbacteria bacterium]|nr:MBL fold metallo-hydrolase [Candidatus Harrisonbacteria bacterium]
MRQKPRSLLAVRILLIRNYSDMTIQWYGEGCFKIQSSDTVILIDPVDKSTGLSAPRFKHDILMKTSLEALSPEKDFAREESEAYVIYGPGEYEIQGVQITGWPLKKDLESGSLNSIFRVKMEDLRLGFLGGLASFNEPEMLEELGDIDILFIPGGNTPYLSQGEAAKLVRQIEPRMVIPSHIKAKGLKRKSQGPEAFLKELSLSAQPQEKITIKFKDLTEKMQAGVLTV